MVTVVVDTTVTTVVVTIYVCSMVTLVMVVIEVVANIKYSIVATFRDQTMDIVILVVLLQTLFIVHP